ncbi:MAG: DUF2079 domain-containing protein [Anaerolineae bacterium]|nr:DUF2079 domain-containing protein [Anaerolineae bacterium]
MGRSSASYAAAFIIGGALLLAVVGFQLAGLPFTPAAQFSDSATSHFPASLFSRDSILTLRDFPIWRETIMAGAPFAANPLNKTAYPLQWLALAFPPAQHLNVMLLLHISIAAIGMWAWTRVVGISRSAAAFATIAYAFSPRLVAHAGAGHLDIVYAMAWLPWLMHSARKFGQTPQLATALIFSLFASLLLLSDVRISLFGYGAAGIYILFEMRGHIRASVLWVMAAGVIWLALTASVTVPLIGWSPYLNRSGLALADAAVYSLEPGNFIGIVLPGMTGNVEMLVYVGLPTLLLVIVGFCGKLPHKWMWLGLIACGIVWSLGENSAIWTLINTVIPQFRWFRVPSRAWIMVVLLFCFVAAYGFDTIASWMAKVKRDGYWRGLRRWRMGLIGLLAFAIAGAVFTWIVLPLPDISGWILLLGGAGIVLLLVSSSGKLRWPLIAQGLLIVLFLELLLNATFWLEWRGQEDWLTPYTPLAERLLEENPERIYAPAYSLPQQAAEVYGLKLFGGVDPFQLRGVSEAIMRAGGVEFEGYSVVMPPLVGLFDNDITTANDDAVPDASLLAEWSVSHVIAPYEITVPGLALLDTVNGINIYQNLDYQFDAAATFIEPAFPEGWPDLPAPSEIGRLNNLTILAASISGISLLAVLMVLARIRFRS